MARHAVVTGAAVSMTPEIQVSEGKPRVELPAWVTKFVVVVNALREWGSLNTTALSPPAADPAGSARA